MAVYTLNEDGIATLMRSVLTQGELEILVQTQQIEEGIPISSCIKDTLAAVTAKKVSKPNMDGEV